MGQLHFSFQHLVMWEFGRYAEVFNALHCCPSLVYVFVQLPPMRQLPQAANSTVMLSFMNYTAQVGAGSMTGTVSQFVVER